MWDSISSLASEAMGSVETMLGMGDKPKQIAETSNFAQPDYAGMEADAFGTGAGAEYERGTVGESGALKGVAEDENSWVSDALKPAMTSILGAAMRPKPMQHAVGGAGGAGGISASGNGALAPFNEVTKMADNNPLDDLHSWANLFG